jgi:two-component system NarL family sensor kinase
MSPGPRPYGHRELVYVAIVRLFGPPTFFALLLLSGEPLTLGIWLVAIPSAIYVLAAFALSISSRWERVPPAAFVAGDLVTICAAIAVAGGAGSEVVILLFAWPVAAAVLFPPRGVIACVGAAMACLALASAPAIAGGDDHAVEDLLIAEVSLAWIGLFTGLAAGVFRSRQRRIGALSQSRRSLLADALSAEDRARRRLSQSLHDQALQTLLAAGQDLDAGIESKDEAQLRRARDELRTAVRSLRETIRGLHPAALEHGGLAGGLDAVVEGAAGRGGFTVDLRVDPDAAGPHDALIVSLVRELATNAVKHSEASRLAVEVSAADGEVRVEFADDGRGMPEGARSAALASGHIGLASSQERVEAAGGSMEVLSAPDRGTTIRISLPVAERARASLDEPARRLEASPG